MGTSLRLAGIIMLLIGAYLTIPKIVETAAAFNTVTAKVSETAVSDTFIDDTLESSVSENPLLYKAVSDNSYEPPNYGGPDSQQGSGTR